MTLQAMIAALAQTYLDEGRPEATETARALQSGSAALATRHPGPARGPSMIAALAISPHPAAAAVSAAFDHIPWGENPVAAKVGAASAIFAVSTLMGPEGPIHDPVLRMGLFWQDPDTYYALHAHDADETYVILAGSALWQAGDDRRHRSAGEMIHHPSQMPHAFRAGPQGLLALWRWSGDTNTHSYHFLPDSETNRLPASFG